MVFISSCEDSEFQWLNLLQIFLQKLEKNTQLVIVLLYNLQIAMLDFSLIAGYILDCVNLEL